MSNYKPPYESQEDFDRRYHESLQRAMDYVKRQKEIENGVPMNAYELADELQELDSKLHLINLFKSANMLRQQADRIAELEKAQRFIQNFAKEQHHRACALEEAQTNAEPVAWIIKHEDGDFGNISCVKRELQEEIDECTKNVPHWNHGTILPLYTTPKDQADRIAELEKELQPTHHEATPCCGYHLADAIQFNPFNKVVQCHNCGQVYTPQTKPLSDEEIMEIYRSIWAKRMTPDEVKTADIRFARAIEAKVRGKK